MAFTCRTGCIALVAVVLAYWPATAIAQRHSCAIICKHFPSQCHECSDDKPSESQGSSYDHGAARRAQEAAEQQRREEAARVERERIAEEQRRQQKQAEFIRNRDAVRLKGSSSTASSGLKGISGAGDQGLKGGGYEAARELKSADFHGHREGEAGRVFDTAGKNTGTLVRPDKTRPQRTAATALDKRIPAGAEKDPEIRRMQDWYRSLDSKTVEKEKHIAQLKEQQKTSKDPILAAKIGTLENDKKRLEDDKKGATDFVGKRLRNLGLEFNEEPPASAAKGAKR